MKNKIIFFILTNPATINPPIVPCDVIDAMAILEANDQSSFLDGKLIGFVMNFVESMLSVGDDKLCGTLNK